jgi:hypothetical protein
MCAKRSSLLVLSGKQFCTGGGMLLAEILGRTIGGAMAGIIVMIVVFSLLQLAGYQPTILLLYILMIVGGYVWPVSYLFGLQKKKQVRIRKIEEFIEEFLKGKYIQDRIDKALTQEAEVCLRKRNRVLDLQQNGVKNSLVRFDEVYEESKEMLRRSENRFCYVYDRFSDLKSSFRFSLKARNWQAYLPEKAQPVISEQPLPVLDSDEPAIQC